MTLWDRIKDKVKKVLIVLGALFTAIASIFAIKWLNEDKNEQIDRTIEDTDEINRKAAQKSNEAVNRIKSASARKLAESYGSVSDTIADGKKRLRDRCIEWTENEDARR